jgi:2-C-methyl-D-erythritol 2,4-cyclodiphosphate synthase
VLGAAADGDLGRHYPDTDARWKDACSLDLLRDTAQRLAGRGLRIVNIDATLLAEAPRIAPHVQEMRRRLAAAAGIDEEAVSVKATTTEGMGAVGRREGMAAMAVATVTGEGKGS